jgi:hypothetical protein
MKPDITIVNIYTVSLTNKLREGGGVRQKAPCLLSKVCEMRGERYCGGRTKDRRMTLCQAHVRSNDFDALFFFCNNYERSERGVGRHVAPSALFISENNERI